MNLEQIMPLSYWAISIVAVLCVLEFVWIIAIHRKMRSFEKSYIALQTFLNGGSLDEQLKEYLRGVKEIRADLRMVEQRIGQAEEKLRASVDRVELVRFNAFDNMGSDLSFALALMNQEEDGIVISSINSREESRVYAKPLVKGESSYHLSSEEKEVIKKAKKTIKV